MSVVITIIISLLVYTCGQSRGDWCFPESLECLKAQNELLIKDEAQKMAYEKACHTPRLISSAEGVNLYVTGNTNCNGEVYFSRSGTHTTHEECYSSGKTRHCAIINDDVSN